MDNLANPSALEGKVKVDTTIDKASGKLQTRALSPMLVLMLIFMLVFPWVAKQLPDALRSYLAAIHN
jgi:hypothetical protein